MRLLRFSRAYAALLLLILSSGSNLVVAQSCPEIDLDESRITRLGKIFDQLSPTLVRQVHNRMQAEMSISGDKMGMFVERYGISAAEARLLATLVEGRTVVEHAGLAGISINTARTHMRRLLDKSGAANQLDLLRKFFET